jgi:hypothetical protein
VHGPSSAPIDFSKEKRNRKPRTFERWEENGVHYTAVPLFILVRSMEDLTDRDAREVILRAILKSNFIDWVRTNLNVELDFRFVTTKWLKDLYAKNSNSNTRKARDTS